MNKVRCEIWGRRFELSVDFQNYPGQDILKQQKEALQQFISKIPEDLITTEQIERYCKKVSPKELPEGFRNVFKYVMPASIYVPRYNNKHIVVVMCNYRFDEENGIAMIFEDGRLNQIGIQDTIL